MLKKTNKIDVITDKTQILGNEIAFDVYDKFESEIDNSNKCKHVANIFVNSLINHIQNENNEYVFAMLFFFFKK